MVRVAPRIRANNTSTPPSPKPQNELQKSRDRFCRTGVFLAYFERDVVDDCLLADMVEKVRRKRKEEIEGVKSVEMDQVQGPYTAASMAINHYFCGINYYSR